MSASNFSAALAMVLSYEGGLVDNPADIAGITNWGVTVHSLSAFLGRPCGANDIRCLTRATVAPLYKRDFWDLIDGDVLPPGVDLIVFDGAVNQGPGTIARMLQRAAGVAADGQIGPVTLAAISTVPSTLMVERVRRARLAAYQADGGWPTFGEGWIRRLNGIAQTAAAWASKGGPPPAAAANDPAQIDPIAATKAAIGAA